MVRVVADTDTLCGGTTRGLLIHLDYRGLIRLHWSALILTELSRALVDTGRKVDAPAAQRHEQLMRDSLPHAEIDLASVNAQIAVAAAAVRSKKDAHVAACAHAIVADKYYPQDKAVSLVTKNIRDFRVRKLAEIGVEVKRPDDFLLAATGLGRSTIYRLIADGSFPAPVRLGPRAVAWRWSDLDLWARSRPGTH